MATVAASVRVVLGNPGLENSGGLLTAMVPVLNAGDTRLADLACTDLTLGAAPRASPPGFPLVLGALAPGAVASLIGKFGSAGLAAGSRVLLTFRGRYQVGGVAYGLTLSRYVVVPEVSPPAVVALKARVASAAAGTFWDYTLSNDEPAGSAQHVAAFSMKVAAPVTVTGTPPGWQVQTDNASFVLWTAADPLPPYPNHIAPGQSLAGFQLMSPRTSSEASPFTVTAWNHAEDEAGLVVADYVLVPNRVS